MRPLAFPRALAVVGLLGFTLVLTVGADVIFAVALFRSADWAAPIATGPAVVLQATAVAIPLAILVSAWRAHRRADAPADRALTRGELLAVTGLLGLIVVAARSLRLLHPPEQPDDRERADDGDGRQPAAI